MIKSILFHNRVTFLYLILITLLISCSDQGPLSSQEQPDAPGNISAVIANPNIGMQLRREHSSVVFDNKIWMIGGAHGRYEFADVWYSEDGIHWTLATEEPGFSERRNHTSVVFDNKIWVVGGETIGGIFDDVWYSEDGVNWTMATDEAEFLSRSNHSMVVYDGKMWVIAGWYYDEGSYEGGYINDHYTKEVWYSEDGIHWHLATDKAAFHERRHHGSVVFKDKMWVIGGSYREETSEIYEYFNDVWYSEDGIEWTLAASEGEFPTISTPELVVFDDKIWIIGGQNPNGIVNEIWYSSDGVNWTKAGTFFGRVKHTINVFKNKIWGIGGGSENLPEHNDVWYLKFQ